MERASLAQIISDQNMRFGSLRSPKWTPFCTVSQPIEVPILLQGPKIYSNQMSRLGKSFNQPGDRPQSCNFRKAAEWNGMPLQASFGIRNFYIRNFDPGSLSEIKKYRPPNGRRRRLKQPQSLVGRVAPSAPPFLQLLTERRAFGAFAHKRFFRCWSKKLSHPRP